jgi:hypothetical protein
MEGRSEEGTFRKANRVSFTETFQSSEEEKPHKFTIDRSLARGIQYILLH